MRVAQVRIAISLRFSFFFSPKPGALIHKTFKTPFNLLRIIVVRASPSISSAIITRSFFQEFTSCSNRGRISFILEIFLSVMSIGAFDISQLILSLFDTIYGLIYP
jgi:hypothetical protein